MLLVMQASDVLSFLSNLEREVPPFAEMITDDDGNQKEFVHSHNMEMVDGFLKINIDVPSPDKSDDHMYHIDVQCEQHDLLDNHLIRKIKEHVAAFFTGDLYPKIRAELNSGESQAVGE